MPVAAVAKCLRIVRSPPVTRHYLARFGATGRDFLKKLSMLLYSRLGHSMQYAQPELWREFYSTFGNSAAALVGLLFVANSLHLNKLKSDALLHRRARNISLVMMLLFVQALAILAPQDHKVLGAEICALNLIMAYFPCSVALAMFRQKIPLPVTRIVPGMLCPIAGALGGFLLMVNWRWSLHVVAASNALALFVLVANAWSMMLGAWRTDLLTQSKANV